MPINNRLHIYKCNYKTSTKGYEMKYKKTKLSLMITSILLGATVNAAESEDKLTDLQRKKLEAEEVITITGSRSSINKASMIKRTADSLIDVITMDEIGLMPDEDVGAVIERMSNVTNNTSRGEGFQTLIRGLSADLTMTTYNGRELAGSQDGRELATGNLPAGLLHRIKVIKSTTADLIEGGMAGTVELESIKPLSLDERVFSINAKAIRSDMPTNDLVDNTGFQGGLVFIDQFLDGTLGIAANVTYSNRPMINAEYRSRQKPEAGPDPKRDPNGGFGDLNGDGYVDFLTIEPWVESDVVEKEQLGLGFAVQWRPNDDWEVNVDALYSYDDKTGFKNWNRFRNRGNTRYTVVESDPSAVGSALTNAGNIVNGALVTKQDVEYSQNMFQFLNHKTEDETKAAGINIARYFGDGWKVSADLAYSYADDHNGLNNMAFMRRNVGYTLDISEKWPTVTNVHDSRTGEAIDLINPEFHTNINDGYRPLFFNEGVEYREDEVTSARIDFEKRLDFSILSRVSFGIRATERQKKDWKENFSVSGTNPFCADGVSADGVSDLPSFQCSVDVANQVFNANNPHAKILASNNFLQGFNMSFDDVLALRGHTTQAEKDARVNEEGLSNATERYTIDEEYLALYVRADFETEIGDTFIWGNIGLRYVDTETISTNHTSTFTVTTDEDGAIEDVQVDPVDINDVHFVGHVSSYSNLLPSINVVIEPHEEFQIRLAAGQTMTRPQFPDLGEALEITGGPKADDPASAGNPIEATAGNPFLEAYKSTQFDASFEWYPNEDTTVTIGYFYKDIDGFVQPTQYEIELPDSEGQLHPIIVNGVGINPESSGFSGWELGYAQAFTFLPGILQYTGISMNYSILDSDVDVVETYRFPNATEPGGSSCLDDTNTSDGLICSPTVTNPSNFSDYTANAQIYYADKDFNVRLSLKKKGDQVRQQQGLGFETGYTIIDFSARYKVFKNFQIIATVNNVTNARMTRYWQDPWGSSSNANIQRHMEYGRRFSLGFSYNL